MTRDAYVRMDVDTRLVYNKRMRALQRASPEHWPSYAMAYLALLGEAWHGRSRDVSLADAWPLALPVPLEDAEAALRSVGLIDRRNRIPQDAWDDWYGPASRRSEAGRKGAAMRWHSDGNPQPTRTTSQTDSSSRKRTRSNGATTPMVDMKQALADAGLDLGKMPKKH